MSSPGGLSAGLAFLPNWLNDTKDALALDTLLSGWVRASGWRSAGVIWPAERPPEVFLTARPDGVDRPAAPPAELADVLKSLQSGSPTVVWQTPGSAGRLYALLTPRCRPVGVVWADRGPGDPWVEAERNYLRLAARLIERSPSFTARLGPAVDPDRLQQRLADAAVIAGRMAHDFDNILTGIIGFADLSVPLLQPGSQPAKFVAEISKGGLRGSQFTTELHQLSRSGHAKPTPGSVAAAVAKEEARLKPQMPPGAVFQTAIPTGLTPVAMDADLLGAAVGRLASNAVEAVPAFGRVVVSARLVELSRADAQGYLGAANPGPHVEITVQDTGPGIKPDVRAKLFAEPFFTTKVRHRGLGLAVVYRTLVAHRGGVRIDPAGPDGGTAAKIVIPPAAARPAVAAPAHTPAPAFRG